MDAACLRLWYKGSYDEAKSDALEWEEGSRLSRLVTGRNYFFLACLAVSCACLKSPKSLSLRDAVLDVAHHSGESTTRDELRTSH